MIERLHAEKAFIGTGDWAIAIGELYPNAEIIGTDISVSRQFPRDGPIMLRSYRLKQNQRQFNVCSSMIHPA